MMGKLVYIDKTEKFDSDPDVIEMGAALLEKVERSGKQEVKLTSAVGFLTGKFRKSKNDSLLIISNLICRGKFHLKGNGDLILAG